MIDSFDIRALPTAAKVSEESSTLAEKLAKQIEWMQKKGIDISLKESERPARPPRKPPLPGTVIYFSDMS
jgi:hypothetical protein